jgi:hypothetical protein
VDTRQSSGWYLEQVDGHDIGALIESLQSVSAPSTHFITRLMHHVSRIKHGLRHAGQPAVIVAHTVKGKGHFIR